MLVYVAYTFRIITNDNDNYFTSIFVAPNKE